MHSLISIFSLLFIFAVNTARGEIVSNPALSIHEEIGETISAEENAEFNIFGDIDGFSAAKLYSINESSYSLHLLRNFQGHAQLIITGLALAEFDELSTALDLRYSNMAEDSSLTDNPIFFIDDSLWCENSSGMKLVLLNGDVITGTFENARGDTLTVLSDGGLLISIPDDRISNVVLPHGEHGGFTRYDPNTTRLFFTPTARNIKKGSGYFADYAILFPTVAYGLTNNIAISGGVSIIPGVERQVWFFAPKLSFNLSTGSDLAFGAFLVDPPEKDNSEILGFAVYTLGDLQKSITLALATPLLHRVGDSNILIAGGEIQISDRAKLITENWLILDTETPKVFSAGVRFFGEKLAIDLAFITAAEMWNNEGWPLIPWIDFSILF